MIEPSSSEEDEEEVPDAPTQPKNLDVPNGKLAKNGLNGNEINKKDNVKHETVTSPTLSQNSENGLTAAELEVKSSVDFDLIREM